MKKAQEASAYMIYDPSNPSNHRLLMEKMRAWKQLPKKSKQPRFMKIGQILLCVDILF